MRKTSLNIMLVVCVFIMTLTGPSVARTIYVDPNGSANFTSIQAAINDANNGDEICVLPGTYYEAINFLGKAVRLYSSGGRDVTTIHGHYSLPVVCRSGEDAKTVLEDFTIKYMGMYCESSSPTVTNCTFTGGYSDGSGGGMSNFYSSPTVTNCTFTGNKATEYGAGMVNINSSPTVTNCTFSGNWAGEGGGGMFNEQSSPTVTDCNFSDNSADDCGGGGMLNCSSNPTVTNCTFSGNSAWWDGGGMSCEDSSPTVTNCTFSGNRVLRISYYPACGGGMSCGNSSPTVTNCTFEDNMADQYGGGMYNSSSSPTITNCIFSGNSAFYDGGGMFNGSSSNSTVTNCIFRGNSADYGDGGGMGNHYSSPTVTNCVFSSNSALYGGGGMFNYSSSATVTNCILWGDIPPVFADENMSFSTVSCSDVQGGWPGTGNINADPCFANPDANDYHLLPGSPCIDAGDTAAACSALDLDGNPRAIDDPHTTNAGLSASDSLNVVDMGAYEFQPCRIAGDINCDVVVDFKDLAILANHWLEGM